MDMVFSNNLKKFRQQKNLTQEQVAEALHVSTHTVSRWECNTTLPDITMVPKIARLYCVTIDDFFRETSAAYENYAQRLAALYEATREPEDFIAADLEFRKIIKNADSTAEDLRLYGIMHQYMMHYCIRRATELFDWALEKGKDINEDIYWRTKHQKLLLCSQIGKGRESIDSALEIVNKGSEDPEEWICLIAAYSYNGEEEKAYEWFLRAVRKFPDKAALYIYGGDACKKLGRCDEALSCWDKALEIDNTFHDAKYSKVSYYEENGDYETAYKIRLEIIEELRQAGCDIEADADEKLAQECLEKRDRQAREDGSPDSSEDV